jgi:hypothetical protein
LLAEARRVVLHSDPLLRWYFKLPIAALHFSHEEEGMAFELRSSEQLTSCLPEPGLSVMANTLMNEVKLTEFFTDLVVHSLHL